jgi:hypothetical protein
MRLGEEVILLWLVLLLAQGVEISWNEAIDEHL